MKTCLVVDDSSVIRKVARRILEGLEFEISEAEDGEEALTACQKRLPDAILLDWNMAFLPAGLHAVSDGLSASETYRAPFGKRPIAGKSQPASLPRTNGWMHR